MSNLYLMIKTHAVTGQKYLCKRQAATERSAINYTGSGFNWKLHLAEFGNRIFTEILYVCPIKNKNEFRRIAIKYSHEFNIVNDPIWANMIIEQGQGGSTSKTNGCKGKKWIFMDDKQKVVAVENLNEYIKNGWSIGFPHHVRLKLSNSLKGRTVFNKGKKMKSLLEYTSRASKLKYYIQHPQQTKLNETFEQRSAISKECLNRPEVILKFKEPRKPLITAQNINTKEIKTLGRSQWYTILKVNYKRLLQGRTSKGWRTM